MVNDWAVQELEAWGNWQRGIMMPFTGYKVPSANALMAYRKRYADEVTEVSSESGNFIHYGYSDDRMQKVDEIVCQCNQTSKTVLVMRFVKGATYERIAKAIKTRKANVSSLISESVDKFAELYLATGTGKL